MGRTTIKPQLTGCPETKNGKHKWQYSYSWSGADKTLLPFHDGGSIARSGWRCFECGKMVWDDNDVSFVALVAEAVYGVNLKYLIAQDIRARSITYEEAERKRRETRLLPPYMPKFRVGDYVEKNKGYKWPGIVVSIFKTTAGMTRYVVECTATEVAGALHIYNEDQLVKAEGAGTGG